MHHRIILQMLWMWRWPRYSSTRDGRDALLGLPWHHPLHQERMGESKREARPARSVRVCRGFPEQHLLFW